MIKAIGKKFNRALHFDFHTSPGIKNILENFDAEKFTEQLKNAHIEYVNLTARCNMGFSYYNTKVGKKYPGLNDRDPFKEMLDACHKRGIGVSAYLNLGIDHEMAADNPNWLKMDKEGNIYKENKKNSFFRAMCHNTPYRQHFIEEVKELCSYDIDGLFCDCFVLKECFCPACIKDMAKRGVDANDEKAVLSYQHAIRREVVEEILSALDEKRGKIKVYFNDTSRKIGFHTHAEIECLTTSNQGFDFFNSMSAYTRTIYEDRVYMSARFQNSWGDFGGLKPLASMQNDLYDAMMNGFALSFGDHLHPVDGFENRVASAIKTVMEEKIKYEPYVKDANNVVEIGVIIHSNDYASTLPYFVKGVARMLKELKLTYNVYDEEGAFDTDNLKLLIVNENENFDNTFKNKLSNYIKNGGKVIFTASAIDLGKEIGALDYIGEPIIDERDNAYYLTSESDMRIAMYNPSRIIKNINGKELCKYVSNVVNFIWDGRHSYRYRPQGEKTEYSAVVINENTACICFDVFTAYADNFLIDHRDLFEKVINELLPERLIVSTNMPKTATVSLTKNDAHTVLHIKSTYPEHKGTRGIIEEHNYMKSATVSLLGEYGEIYSLPDLTKLNSKIDNNRTYFETGDILGYKAFLLK